MQGTTRSGSGLRARTGWTRARRLRQWAQTAAAALAVGCCGVGGTAGSGLETLGRAVKSRAQVRRGQGTALKCLTVGALSREPGLGCWWRRAQSRGGSSADAGKGRAQGSMFGMYGDVWPPSPLFIKPLDN